MAKIRFVKFLAVTILFLVISITLLTAALYLYKNIEKKNITDQVRKQAGGQFIKLSRGYTHYQVDGPDTGKVVILLHGFSVPYYIWDGTFQYLARKGFRVVRYDMYGRGFSDRPYTSYTQDLYMNQLSELIEALDIKKPVSLAGISFGGEVATDFACKHAALIDKVILIDPGYSNKQPLLPQFITLFKETLTPDERALGQLKDFKYPEQHADWINKYKVQMQYKNFRWALASTQYNYPYNGKESSACLNKASKPVLLIWGREDHTVPFALSDSIRSVLKADFFPVDDAAHLPTIEKPEIVNTKIVSFLKQ